MTETVRATNPLETEKIGKLIMRFAIPSIISIVVNSLYNMVDQILLDGELAIWPMLQRMLYFQ